MALKRSMYTVLTVFTASSQSPRLDDSQEEHVYSFNLTLALLFIASCGSTNTQGADREHTHHCRTCSALTQPGPRQEEEDVVQFLCPWPYYPREGRAWAVTGQWHGLQCWAWAVAGQWHGLQLSPFLISWANICFAEHSSEYSMNFTSFLDWAHSSPNMVRTIRRTILRS